jgi:hypothetical protein
MYVNSRGNTGMTDLSGFAGLGSETAGIPE